MYNFLSFENLMSCFKAIFIRTMNGLDISDLVALNLVHHFRVALYAELAHQLKLH